MKKLVLATALLLGSASAFAVTNQSGVYIGALGGWSFASSPNESNVTPSGDGVTAATSQQNRNYTAGGTIGYQYAINQNFAAGIEGSYMYFGYNNYTDVNNNSVKFTNTGWQVMAVGNYLMSNGFNAFVKAGGINEKTDASASGVGAGTGDQTQWLPAVAVGLGYMPMQNLNIALQYEHTFGSNWNNLSSTDNPKPMTQNAVTLGVTYLFPL